MKTTMRMTEGSPLKHILNFALPLLAGMLFQKLYNMVDTAIVGKFISASALAAVGSTGSITFLILGFCMGICSGFAIPVAQFFGAQDYHTMRKCVGTGAIVAGAIALVMTVVTAILCREILILMQTPEDILDMSYEYLFVMFLSIPASVLYNYVSGVLRSLGDSKNPLIFLILSSVLNIALDLLFILVFQWGVAGAAWATLIATLVSGVVSLIYVIKKCELLHLSKEEWAFDRRVAGKLCIYGIPMGLQYSVTAIGSAVLQAFLNQLGTTAVAAYSAGNKLNLVLETPFDALGSAMATYCGQNVGAGKPERLRPGIMGASIVTIIYSVLIFVAMYFFGAQCALLFLNPEETEIIAMTYQFLVIQTAFYPSLALVNVVRFAIQGMGFPIPAIAAGVMELLGRAIVGAVFVPIYGYTAACLGSPAAWIAADFFLIPCCMVSIRKLKKQLTKHSL